MFKKTIQPKNKAALASAIISLVGGAILYIVSAGANIPYPWIMQVVAVALFTYSIYIATACLFKRHTVIIEQTLGAAEGGESGYDLVIYEATGKRERKICHVSTDNIDFIRVVDKKNKRAVANERKNKDRYTYDAQFAAQKRLEVSITNGDEVASILLTYDEEVVNALLTVGVERKY